MRNDGNRVATGTYWGDSKIRIFDRQGELLKVLEGDGFCRKLGWLAQDSLMVVGNDSVRIVNVNSGLALDLAGASSAEGTNVWVWERNGSWAQRWEAGDNDDGTVTFISASSGKALDVSGASSEVGANVRQWSSNGTVGIRLGAKRSLAGAQRSAIHDRNRTATDQFLAYRFSESFINRSTTRTSISRM